MSRKVPETSFPYEEEAEENDTQRTDPPGFVPWSNPNELEATDRNITQGTGTSGTRCMVSSANQQDTSPGAEVLCQPGPARRPPVFIEEERPGAVVVPGIDSDGLTIEEGYDEQVTIASRQESTSTFNVCARTVDTEEEKRIRDERDQFRDERDHFRHELGQLRQMLSNAVIVNPFIATNRGVENRDDNIHADNHDALPSSNRPKCGTRGTRWFAVGVIALIVVAVTVTLAVVLSSKPATARAAETNTTSLPSVAPTDAPALEPTTAPVTETDTPIALPTVAPTDATALAPTTAPFALPTVAPTDAPALAPTTAPFALPPVAPTDAPAFAPTTAAPFAVPTVAPTDAPAFAPTTAPFALPTVAPTDAPALAPTTAPFALPSTVAPTDAPALAPAASPFSPVPDDTDAPT